MAKWMSLSAYKKETQLSKESILKLIDVGELIAVKTEGGHVRIKVDENPELNNLRQELDEVHGLIKGLCNHLGLKRS
ncbi:MULTISPECIES: hypothetical protein [unclassified Fusibacter]|uniref:hypothetical protein n=1 Tax=unclassified Fusibacter TaxID=2624464 RepID=UPI001012E451|nr:MULTISPECIES: hypothetical protein [unclassified Fusibacter]MCK8059728.1 hypothetical protein [Fusibacter sp. A2]NPE21529.1 hypothetical protein [Fusibacter sp. A1]RXV61939.1 hypothetical protein DWB64_06780 [Fusibacter sp. A1]